ncbi:hypothetical protein YT1_1220 [Rhodococcus ruber]|nr:hypothetical protein YT1_1220 [Rhodococcus ruber]
MNRQGGTSSSSNLQECRVRPGWDKARKRRAGPLILRSSDRTDGNM